MLHGNMKTVEKEKKREIGEHCDDRSVGVACRVIIVKGRKSQGGARDTAGNELARGAKAARHDLSPVSVEALRGWAFPVSLARDVYCPEVFSTAPVTLI